jgi:putative ABC transport system substrate-binding protein
MLREVVPNASCIGFIASKHVWDHAPGVAIKEAARQHSIILVGSPLEGVLKEVEYRRVFESLEHEQAQALVVAENPENLQQRRLIVEFAETAHLPTVYPYRAFVESGGLMSYGADISELFGRLAGYADRILKGAKPGLLPIYQATRFDLVINLKSAKALGLNLPAALLTQAEELIE